MKPQTVILLTEAQKHVLRDALRVGAKRSSQPSRLPTIKVDRPPKPVEKSTQEQFAVHCISF